MKVASVLLIGCLMFSGCAATVASFDTDAAIQVAAQVNVVNLKAMGRARMREHDKSLEQIEVIFEQQLAKSSTGADAVKAWTQYKAVKAKALLAKTESSETVQKALNTGFALESLSGRKMALWGEWRAFFGRIPAVAQMQTLAEAEVRNYMATIGDSK
ncbi:hypothetical protein HN588_10505 [Candidatus Bathyarchaeota archaeon]|jgi:hypothetical protein|nr:hypothetical protein [Candidatus Bathyarchaeota archaeon]